MGCLLAVAGDDRVEDPAVGFDGDGVAAVDVPERLRQEASVAAQLGPEAP